MRHGFITPLLLSAILAGGTHGAESDSAHLLAHRPPPASPVAETNELQIPKPAIQPRSSEDIYSVTAHDMPVRQLLLALARDAKVDIDIHPGITGNVSLNAVDQPLERILARIARQVDMRFEIDGNAIAILPDSPFLRHYKVDYVNVSRQTNGAIATNTQIASQSPAGVGPAGSNPAANTGNTSNTRIEHNSKNLFWESLEKNIKDILRETDKILPDGSSETTVEENTSRNASGPTVSPAPSGAGGSRRPLRSAPAAIIPNAVSSAQTAGTSVTRQETAGIEKNLRLIDNIGPAS